MNPKQVSDEIRALAQLAGNLPGGGLLAAETLIHTATTIDLENGSRQKASYGEPDPETVAAEEYIQESLTAFKKGRALWSPPHGIALNQTLMGTWNLWQFTILPLFAARQAYSSGKYSDRPEGVVTQASWRPYQGMKDSFNITKLDLAKKIVGLVKGSATVQETARKELAWVEQKFSVSIPNDIKSKLVSETQKTAARRWGANALRMKKRLIPNDGSKPIDFT